MSSVDAAASGMPYPVVAVDGEATVSLDQFVGETTFVVTKSGAESRVHGVGAADGNMIKFKEKAANGGKDVRDWLIHHNRDGAFTAECAASF